MQILCLPLRPSAINFQGVLLQHTAMGPEKHLGRQVQISLGYRVLNAFYDLLLS